MSWVDKLKGLFPNLRSIVSFTLNINSNNRNKKVELNDSSKQVTINLQKLNQEEKEKLKSIISSAVQEDKILLEQKPKAIIEEFSSEDKSDETQKIISFLRPLVPSADIIIWRASLYMRKHFKERKKDVADLKAEISQRHGTRGNNIANLCTAGYLETILLPLHEALKEAEGDEEKTKERFRNLYTSIIADLPFTIFVSSRMKEEDIEKKIMDKMTRNLKYGTKFLNIHGIGRNNIAKIRETISKIEEKHPSVNKTISEENKIIFAKLRFK